MKGSTHLVIEVPTERVSDVEAFVERLSRLGVCDVCGDEFLQPRRGRPRKRCSSVCSNTAEQRYQASIDRREARRDYMRRQRLAGKTS